MVSDKQGRRKKDAGMNDGGGVSDITDVFTGNLNHAKQWCFVKYNVYILERITSEYSLLCLIFYGTFHTIITVTRLGKTNP